MTSLYEMMQLSDYDSMVNREFTYKGKSVGQLKGFCDLDNQYLVFITETGQKKIRWDMNDGNGRSQLNPLMHHYKLVE
ncbi:hypothetical protein LH23_09660 [Cedecea neteri]|uniref:Uncharacterized protein n=1 Tax=Cedecea neteri TaxID=158822 RepID=A0AAN0S3X4_9ENTR|nr:hypothetical protein [Cedecea neteri]AIR60916.1 hypothetical protein LH23_09660 [Cedecea neteri]